MILAERAARDEERRARLTAEAAVAKAHADRIVLDLELERLRFQLAKARREAFGQSSEAGAKIGQLELALEDIEETIATMQATGEMAAEDIAIDAFTRRKPARRPLPAHLRRVRQVYPSPLACPCCAGRLHKLGEDITETLERIPASWYVIQHVREKFSCRSCEAVTQPPAPSHPIARGRAGPMLLAEIAYGKFCMHLPLHRQSRAFEREGIDIDVSTMADWMGAVSVALKPMAEIIEAHVLAGQRLHVDDTPVPVLAKGKTKTGRLWAVVRDDQPFGGVDPPAAFYIYSPDRGGAHPEAFLVTWSGIMQADAYAGFNRLYEPGRSPGPIIEAGCWAHWRRKFYELAELKKAPVAIEAVKRIDAIFTIERTINGALPSTRQTMREQTIKPLLDDLIAWLRTQRGTLSSKSDTAKAIDYGLKRITAFSRFLGDGRICLSNNAAERAMRCVAMRESLCTPSSSICKHWKRVRIDNATRATFPGHRRFHLLRREVVGPDLMRCAGNNLHGMKDARFDQASYRMVCNA
jgi:transposase